MTDPDITANGCGKVAPLRLNLADNTKQMVKQNAGVTQRQSIWLLTRESRFRNSPPVPIEFGGAAVMVWQETVNLPTSVTIGSIPITSTKMHSVALRYGRTASRS